MTKLNQICAKLELALMDICATVVTIVTISFYYSSD